MRKNSKVRIAIKKSLISLLEIHPIGQVSIKELCEKAEISRAAFYKHFCDIHEFIAAIEEEFLEDLQARIDDAYDKGVKVDFREIFGLIMECLKDDSELYRVICSDNCDMYFTTRMVDYCRNYFESDFRHKAAGASDKAAERTYRFAAQGCGGLLNGWIKGGMIDSPEDLTGFAEKLVSGVYGNLK